MGTNQENLDVKGMGGLVFIKEVAKYFMDFLETDFHRQRNPRRSVQLRNNDNLLIGLDLQKYPIFCNATFHRINNGFQKKEPFEIKKGSFKAVIPQNLIDFVQLRTEKLSQDDILLVIKDSASGISKAVREFNNDVNKAIRVSLENTQTAVGKYLVTPFVDSLQKSLSGLAMGDENDIVMMGRELTEVLAGSFEPRVEETAKRLILGEKPNVKEALASVFNLESASKDINTFFEDYRVDDLFNEIFEMDRNRRILDKQEFYLYFYSITYQKVQYPIFYMPLDVTVTKRRAKTGQDSTPATETILIDTDSQVFINKKALEFVAQEYNKETGGRGRLDLIKDRIIYLSQNQQGFPDMVQGILDEISNFFELSSSIEVTNPGKQVARSSLVQVSNRQYVAIFDKSDEALVNDYENILSMLDVGLSDELAATFSEAIDGFVNENPEPFNPIVEDVWDSLEPWDRLVAPSPIPLNSEQRQIIKAIEQPGCKYIAVEGPPGTGKSHTITALVFNAILKDKSVLVLSDTKEALDVVENKITDTLNKVRYDKNFQNPILRLGKTGNTYNKVLSSSSITGIKNHFRATKRNYAALQDDINKSMEALEKVLQEESEALRAVRLSKINDFTKLEREVKDSLSIIDLDELVEIDDVGAIVERLRAVFAASKQVASEGFFHETFLTNSDVDISLDDFLQKLAYAIDLSIVAGERKCQLGHSIDLLSTVGPISNNKVQKFRSIVAEYQSLKGPLGFLFKGKQVREIDARFSKAFPLIADGIPHKSLERLVSLSGAFEHIQSLETKKKYSDQLVVDKTLAFQRLLLNEKELEDTKNLTRLVDDLKFIDDACKVLPKTTSMMGVDCRLFSTVVDNKLAEMTDEDCDKLIAYLTSLQELTKTFSKIPDSDFAKKEKEIETLVTRQMTYLLDRRVIDFYEKKKTTARALREVIRGKRRFPTDEFSHLKSAFPCIIAGIRDYAEYIPFEPELFDLVIIDEASQVSLAQAFPALLRAKQVIVLGDRKQFSNIKSAQARTDTNIEYLNGLRQVFFENVSADEAKTIRVEKFNIKTSILEFFEFIANYNTRLLKHFRGYKELIGYSNHHFYNDDLQVMKIRGKSIDEVLKFTLVESEFDENKTSKTNIAEIDLIVEQLKALKEQGSEISIGIITPHTNQMKLAMEIISKLPEKDYYFDNNRLKIMTFDTCQGEERDLIFYSMVATEDEDRLWGVFIKDLSQEDIEEGGKIKVQRLNVGLSRARECMHFVHSKPLEDFKGSIGEALRYYFHTAQEARKEYSPKEVDPRSAMEPMVLNWLYQTKFWMNNKDKIELMPQFEIGKYLKQLDPSYAHPAYKVDFLLLCDAGHGQQTRLIIEYDGFQEHFEQNGYVDKDNYDEYYSEEDLYRQKVLEGYGYTFLRINRFNVGNNPIETLDTRISQLISEPSNNHVIADIIDSEAKGLHNGTRKVCPKCQKILENSEFYDPSLKGYFGRICRNCKGKNAEVAHKRAEDDRLTSCRMCDKKCPRCSKPLLKMVPVYGAIKYKCLNCGYSTDGFLPWPYA